MSKLRKGLTKLDLADHLKTEKDIAGFLRASFEEAGDDPAYIAHALGIVARARGMTRLAKETGVTRNALYNSLSKKGNPELATVMKVMNAFGLKLGVA